MVVATEHAHCSQFKGGATEHAQFKGGTTEHAHFVQFKGSTTEHAQFKGGTTEHAWFRLYAPEIDTATLLQSPDVITPLKGVEAAATEIDDRRYAFVVSHPSLKRYVYDV